MDFLEGELSRLWLFSFVSKKYKEKFFNFLLSEVTKYIEKSFENFLLYSSEIIDSNNTNEINLFLYKYPNCFFRSVIIKVNKESGIIPVERRH